MYAGLQSRHAAQTDRLNAVLGEQAGSDNACDILRGDLAHLKEDAAKRIADLQGLLDEALHALASEKIANDLLREVRSSMNYFLITTSVFQALTSISISVSYLHTLYVKPCCWVISASFIRACSGG